MKLKYIIILLFLFLSCKKRTSLKNEFLTSNISIDNNKVSKLNKVVITGTTDDLTAFEYLNIMNNTYLFGRSHLDVKKEIFSDSLYMVLNFIEKPLLSEVVTDGDKGFYRGWVFLIPGDTISIKIKNGKMKFLGKNAVLNNYWSEMNKETPDYAKNPYLGNINKYKENVKSIYTKKVEFLNQYIKNHHIKSNFFKNEMILDLKQEYLFTLMNPKITKARFSNFFVSEFDALIPLVKNETDKNVEEIFDLSNYFENVSIEDFKNSNYLNNFYFKNNINAYVRYYFLDSKYLAYSKEKFLAEKEFIQNNFEGEIENYAIARMIRDYHLKGFGDRLNTIEMLKNLIEEYKDKFTKPSYIEFMNEIKEDLKSYNFELIKTALNSKFININGDTLTLNKIFARSNKRIRVVDFWASWCPPCIKQIKEGKPFKDRLNVENNVEWIYISPEKNYNKWLEKNNEFKHVLNFTNSFFLLKGKNSDLSKAFDINEIPRYIIFNKENKIVLNNAPPPSDKEAFERVIDNIYKNKSK